MVFAWIAVAALCSIHLIFSLVQSWVESKKHPYRVRRFHGANYILYILVIGYLYFAPLIFSGEYDGSHTIKITIFAYGGPILILGLFFLVAQHDMSYIDITSEGFLTQTVFGKEKFTPFAAIDGYIYSPKRKRQTLNGQHWKITQDLSDDLYLIDLWGNTVFSCIPAKPQERIFGALLYARARSGRWPDLENPEDELVIMKLADSKYEVTDFLMEYPQVNGFITPEQTAVPQQPMPPQYPQNAYPQEGYLNSGQQPSNQQMNPYGYLQQPHNYQQNQNPPQGSAS